MAVKITSVISKTFQTMKKNYLFPPVFKRVGLWFFFPFAIIGTGCLFDRGWWGIESSGGFFSSGLYENFPTIAIAGIAASLLLICFSREKDEDEYVNDLRCRTLVWSVIFGYLVLIAGDLFIYGMAFLTFTFVNMYTILLLYAIVFNFRLYRLRKSACDEE